MAVPKLPVLVYDGDCGICTRSARWVQARWPGGSVEPSQALDLDALRLTAHDVATAAWWVEPDGTRRRGHRAIAAALRAIGGAWGIVGRAITLPLLSQLAAGAYFLVARYRGKLPGSTCELPTTR